MKQLLLVLLAILPLFSFAQEDIGSSGDNDHIIYKTIHPKMRIKDKIIIENKSPFYILQIVVAIPEQNGDMIALGSATYIAPNELFELASYRDSWLKKLRGAKIAIKAKAVKLSVGGENQTKVWTPYGSVGVRHKNLDPEIINNIKPEDVTYDFDVKLYEANHDLYIELFSSNGKGVMDF